MSTRRSGRKNNLAPRTRAPGKQGLYDPQFEHDACGVGFVVNMKGRKSHELVEQALQKLPPAQRVPLVLYHLEGMRYEEIAAKLNVSLGKVKTDIFRGRETLRKRLKLRLADELAPV